jgi:hypothetical protein
MRKGALASVALALVLLGTGPSGAADSGQVYLMQRNAGRCSGGNSTSVLAVSRYDRNTLRVRFSIAHSRPGQTWQVFGSNDRVRIFAVTKVTRSDGTVRVRRRTKDRRGPDHVKVAASNTDSGEACSAAVKGF